MEISVCLSADGVLVCSHDPTTARMTGTAYTIAEQTWATLSTLKVSGAETTEPDQPAQPLTRFDDVVETYIGQLRPLRRAQGEGGRRAADGADGRPRPAGAGGLEAPINSAVFAEAKRRGFATWGYVLDEPAHTGAN